jgi:peptidoglycan/LPS O-acetylase OafA/YrhL
VGTVFLGHAFPNFVANSVGVDMFFALSGFLITRGLLLQLESHNRIRLRLFYIRRALRLIPALALVVGSLLIVAAAFSLAGHPAQRPGLRTQIRVSVLALTYVMNWSRALHLSPSGWLGHTWSLSIEEQFYLVWPLILAAIYRVGGIKGSLRCAGTLALVGMLLRIVLYHSGATEDRLYNGLDTRADSLMVGCALVLARPIKLSRWAGRLLPLPFLAIAWVFFFVPWFSKYTLSSDIIAGACAWLILPLWSKTSPRMARALEFGPIRYLGRISYGLYLWHWPVLSILWELHFARNAVTTATLAGAITLLSAAASFHFVEQPILLLKDRIGLRPSTDAGQSEPTNS